MPGPVDATMLKGSDKELWLDCGEDARGHGLEYDSRGILRFQADPVIQKIWELGQVDLNQLWKSLDLSYAGEYPVSKYRRSLRKFYRDMGYTLCGYMEIFGEHLDEERPVCEKVQKTEERKLKRMMRSRS